MVSMVSLSSQPTFGGAGERWTRKRYPGRKSEGKTQGALRSERGYQRGQDDEEEERRNPREDGSAQGTPSFPCRQCCCCWSFSWCLRRQRAYLHPNLDAPRRFPFQYSAPCRAMWCRRGFHCCRLRLQQQGIMAVKACALTPHHHHHPPPMQRIAAVPLPSTRWLGEGKTRRESASCFAPCFPPFTSYGRGVLVSVSGLQGPALPQWIATSAASKSQSLAWTPT